MDTDIKDVMWLLPGRYWRQRRKGEILLTSFLLPSNLSLKNPTEYLLTLEPKENTLHYPHTEEQRRARNWGGYVLW